MSSTLHDRRRAVPQTDSSETGADSGSVASTIDERRFSVLTADSPFQKVAKKLASLVSPMREEIGESAIDELREAFDRRRSEGIDYEKLAQAFTYRYLLENYWKAVAVFAADRPSAVHRLADFGCGGGAATLAYLAYLESTADCDQWRVHIQLIDKSATQLGIVRRILESVQGDFERVRFSVDETCVDLQTWDGSADERSDLVLLAHVLTESESLAITLLPRVFEWCSPGAQIYVIEEEDDPSWKDTICSLRDLLLPYSFKTVAWSRKAIATALRRDRHSPLMRTQYLALQIPRHKRVVRLAQKYFDAWKYRSVDEIAEVFTADAEYFDNPLESPQVGIDAIKRYWLLNVVPQRHIELSFLDAAVIDNRIWIRWDARFFVRSEFVELSGMMIMTYDVVTDRISELRECYRSRKTPDVKHPRARR